MKLCEKILWFLWGIDLVALGIMCFIYKEEVHDGASHNVIFMCGVAITVLVITFMLPLLYTLFKLTMRYCDGITPVNNTCKFCGLNNLKNADRISINNRLNPVDFVYTPQPAVVEYYPTQPHISEGI